MKENYIPTETEEEIAEGMMNETQKELTEQRKKMFEGLKKMGKTGYIELSFFNGRTAKNHGYGGTKDGERIMGMIDNYLVDIVVADEELPPTDTTGRSDAAFGTINGKNLGEKQTRDIFNKYKDIAINTITDKFGKDKMEKARGEVEKENVDFMASEILS